MTFDWPLAPASESPTSIIETEAARLAGMLGAQITPADFAALDAPPVVYGITDRPLASGRLPEVSAAGAPAYLARVADPKNPLGDTPSEAMERVRIEHRADVYARATERLRNRKTSHSPGLGPRPDASVLLFGDVTRDRLEGDADD